MSTLLSELSALRYESGSKKITKSQAGAILISEIELAIEKWNQQALQAHHGSRDKSPLFKVDFQQNEYSPEAKEKSGLFGYANLTIHVKQDGVITKIYDKGQNFAKERDMNNVNGYFPELAFDCLGFLISAGLMYNLALVNENPDKTKEPKDGKAANRKSRNIPKSQS